MVSCPACQRRVRARDINSHLDSDCKLHIVADGDSEDEPAAAPPPSTAPAAAPPQAKRPTTSFFTPAVRRTADVRDRGPSEPGSSPAPPPFSTQAVSTAPPPPSSHAHGVKRELEPTDAEEHISSPTDGDRGSKRARLGSRAQHAPLAERMRPRSLDEVAGQALVGTGGVLRGLIERDRVPSMILWGGPGTGKTTIARLLAATAGARFVEINSTASGVAECKRLFAEARSELSLTRRKTILFCDEIHRFSKSQQDVFLAPVEAGIVTLIGATTENPSFKVQSALLSRCRTFTLEKLGEDDVFAILKRALEKEVPGLPTPSASPADEAGEDPAAQFEPCYQLLTDDGYALLHYLAAFADGDARTGLNLLELALDLCQRPDMTVEEIKSSLTQTLVYDRAGDQHYDTISAFHKSVRGSNPDAALYYLARMLQSGEDPLYIARRMVVIASEDVGLADNSLLPLATAAYSAAEKIGMPECRINLGHCAVALAMAPKSVRAYRGLNAAYAALSEPGIAGLPVPVHLRNAPTRLMKELGYGKAYKYNPNFVDGRVVQQYLPEKMEGRQFLGSMDLGSELDPDFAEPEEQRNVAQGADSGDATAEMLLDPDGD